ncbi:MAG: heavy metal translocating P-type ATPase [Candidatus Parabeggiatoa sp. nov. 3]|jgi:Cu2+-exporting ATPase|nr:MAG: heavy metal translocating P-type ATPase [Gammaproteobacteria bacterium]RKZ90119.1 MAG: heavy metal translocating P-type ATPase [Gammaproteobacteria bacterium]
MIATLIITTGILYGITKIGQNNKNRRKSAQAKNKNVLEIIQTFKKNSRAVFSKERRQQMEQLAGGRYEVKSAAEKRVDRALMLSSINVGIAGMSFFYPPLIWLTVPSMIYGMIPMYEWTFRTLVKEKRLSVYVLDSVMIAGAFMGRYFAILALTGWLEVIIFKIRYLNEQAAKQNIGNLFGELPHSVWVLMDNQLEIEMPFDELQVGDTVVVNAGQTIPIDGIIKSGFASVDQHKLTGESQPIECGEGDAVLASTTVLAGKLYIEVEKTGQETVAMQIGQILNHTADYKDSILSRAERIADRAVPITAGLFLVTLPVLGLNSGLAVLSNKFGNKMKEFGPVSMIISLNLACEQGILIKDGRSLELLNEIDTVIFDKTGTLTLEQPTVGKIHCFNGASENDILKYAAAAEQGQTHPVAKAILKATNDRELQAIKMEEAKYQVGYGIQVKLADRIVWVGNHKFMVMENIAMPADICQIQKESHEQGHSLVYVAFDDQVAGVIELQATIRPEAKEIIDYLHQRDIATYIISGDHEAPTKKLAETLGIDHYFANTLPENKADLVEGLRKEGKSICFVGDGINDSIALKKANVSVSLHGATTVATDTAQIILMDGTLDKFTYLFEIVKEFNSNMQKNFIFATVPAGISLIGVFFFNWGFLAATLLSRGVQVLGLGNSLLPLFKQQAKKNDE